VTVVLFLLVVLLLMPYVAGPFLLREQFRQYRQPRIEGLEDAVQPRVAREYFDEVAPQLLALGLSPGHGGHIELSVESHAFFKLFRDATGETLALATAIPVSGAAGGETPVARYVEFFTRWPDGRELLTNNATIVQPFPAARRRSVLRMPRVDDLALLLRVHGERVASEARTETPVTTAINEELQVVANSAMGWLEAQVRRGYLELDEAQNAWVLTWKGAFVAVWRNLVPLKDLIDRRARLRARRFLESLHLEVPSVLVGKSRSPEPGKKTLQPPPVRIQ
jgi:hypothetical protein